MIGERLCSFGAVAAAQALGTQCQRNAPSLLTFEIDLSIGLLKELGRCRSRSEARTATAVTSDSASGYGEQRLPVALGFPRFCLAVADRLLRSVVCKNASAKDDHATPHSEVRARSGAGEDVRRLTKFADQLAAVLWRAALARQAMRLIYGGGEHVVLPLAYRSR